MNFGGRNSNGEAHRRARAGRRVGDYGVVGRRGQATADEIDRGLLKAHLAGDRRAFAVLAQRYYPQLFAMARRYRRDDFDPHDGVQEGLARAMAGAASFRGSSTVATWLNCIVKNACIDHNRGRFGVTPVCDGEEEFDACVTQNPVSTPDIALRLTMASALKRLPSDQRDALLYLDIFGYSLQETSRCFGEPSGTLKSRRARARTSLRRQLEEVHVA
jgi:RNA polymerase sigma-70 factor (ECF subfamily)